MQAERWWDHAVVGSASRLRPRDEGEYLIDREIEIPRLPGAVYAFLADIQEAEPIPRRARVVMVKEPLGPTAVGTRWHERVRLAPGLWLHVESLVTQAEDPHRLAMDFTSRWWTGQLTYEIEATDAGTLLHHREVIRPRALLWSLTPMIGRRLDRKIQERLVDIRALVTTR
jgi:hypothetical protein